MLFSEYVLVKNNYKTSKMYQGAEVAGDMLKVKVTSLAPQSNVIVECKCDECEILFNQRYARQHQYCKTCMASILAKTNEKFKRPTSDFDLNTNPEEVREGILNAGSLAKYAKSKGVTPATVRGYILRHDISLPSYLGNKKDFEISEDEKGLVVSEIARIKGVSNTCVMRVMKRKGIEYKTTTDEWKHKRQMVLDNFEEIKRRNETQNIIEIVNDLGLSYEITKQVIKEKGYSIKIQSYNKSKGELEVRDYIRGLGFECNSFKLKDDFGIFELDCYVEDKKFAVEYCGEFWHSDLFLDKNYHKNKTDRAFSKGINLLTIFESEWKIKKDIIKAMINSRLGINEKIYARKCDVSLVENSVARKFHNDNHLHGYVNSSKSVGLFHGGELVAVASISKSRFNRDAEYELTRMSFKKGVTVVGGASKMLKSLGDISLMTYSDLRVGRGEVYKSCGFKFVSETPANYWYYDKKDPLTGLQSRIKYQKHKILSSFSNADQTMTEKEIMDANGFFRVYDCGSNKFVRGS